MSTYSYRLRERADRFDTEALHAAMTAANLPTRIVDASAAALQVSVIFESPIDAAQETTLAALVETQVAACFPLSESKQMKFDEIDARTGQLIDVGFSYVGKRFSLSASAQSSLIGIDHARSDPALTYPINWNTIDDLDFHALADANDAHGFFLTAFGTYRAVLDAGTGLKDQVRAATTRAEVEAVVDPR
jgi:hypothetical protein